MNILDTLKHLKHIQPDAGYTARSRFAFVGKEPAPRLTFWRVCLQIIQTGSAVALVGVFLVLIVGGFSTWQFLTPFRISSLDPTGLKAEAQAIDIQIQLANVEYREKSPHEVTTPAIAVAEHQPEVVQKLVEHLGLATTTAPDAVLSIDDALDALLN